VAPWADLPPHSVVRIAREGSVTDLLACRMIWLCASCVTCSTRCPNKVPVAELMDALRQEANARGVACALPDIRTSYAAFLDEIRRRGRLHEVSFINRYKWRSGHWLQDARLGAALFLRGKLKMWPERVPLPPSLADRGREEAKR
jgi:heterodisulfide reductase subunit C